ncbi:sigma 54-interacting transcriptional regulator [Marinomonas sp. 5E14-1]|uniref:sigma 54-interacting transcriptional regulator n=1 Tax=Marinomonas sp. 5E14-1 TaxID=3153922 RepID=UPI003265FBB5
MALIEAGSCHDSVLKELINRPILCQTEFIFFSTESPNPTLDHLIKKDAGFHYRAPYHFSLIDSSLQEIFCELNLTKESTNVQTSYLDQFRLLVGSSASMHSLYRTIGHKDHQGVFEQAEGGTLFLDEVTEMPYEHQVKLLRVLESSEYKTVGSQHVKIANVRIIAATNRIPSEAIHSEIFRDDLYFRLAQFPIYASKLRDKEGDVFGLAQYFLAYRNNQDGLAEFLLLKNEDNDNDIEQKSKTQEKFYRSAQSDIRAGKHSSAE